VTNILALFRYRDLLLTWTLREVRVRYKQSVLGAAWAIFQPLSMMAVFTVVFSIFLSVPTDGVPYPVFVFATLLPWTFFATAVGSAIPSLVANAQLVTKIYFPREILPLACVGAALVDFLVGSILLLPLLAWYQVPLSWALLWTPALLVVQIILILGVVLPAAALNVFYRDIRFVIPLTLQLLLYATPVAYPLTAVPSWLRPWYALNPMVGITDAWRQVLLHGQPPDARSFVISVVVSVAFACGGYIYFKRVEGLFADMI
jgi:lipopolysaccharide transport system permease protein